MKLKFFSRKSKGSDKGAPINSDSALVVSTVEGQPKKNGSSSEALVNVDSVHNGSVPVHRKANNLKKVPVNRSAHNSAVPAPRKMLFGRKKNDSKNTSAVSQDSGLLRLPGDLHFSVLGKFLNPGDWARLAVTCKGLRPFYSKKIKSYKDELTQYVTELVSATVLSDPFFEGFPIDYLRLGKILKKSGPIIKMMSSFNFEPWQIAALLGMNDVLQDSYSLKDANGYTVLHYKVVGGVRYVVENHIEHSRCPSAMEYYELAEIAAAAGSVEIIDMIIDHGIGVFNMQWRNPKTGMTFTEFAYRFDQDETVTWLLDQGAPGLPAYTEDKTGVSLHRDANVASVVYEACRYGSLELLKELTEKFGDECLKATDKNNQTLLHYAFLSDHLPLIEWLVEEHHLSLSAEDASGKTPFHMLAEVAQGRPERWRSLPSIAEKYGIEYVTEFRDKSGLSVKDYLKSAGQPDVLAGINAMCRHDHGLK